LGAQVLINESWYQIRLSQVLLSSMGLYHGAIDGMDGEETRQAIEAFQSQQKLTKSGKLDQQTLSAMSGLAESAFNNSAQEGRAAAVGGSNGAMNNGAMKNTQGAGGTNTNSPGMTNNNGATNSTPNK
jgi:peptidoglycan hydrolase-like protein with peptidoglycan-binding domain